jgi:hypothetical protein
MTADIIAFCSTGFSADGSQTRPAISCGIIDPSVERLGRGCSPMERAFVNHVPRPIVLDIAPFVVDWMEPLGSRASRCIKTHRVGRTGENGWIVAHS